MDHNSQERRPFERRALYVPQPQEIEAAKEIIQRKWTKEQEYQRRVGLAPTLDIGRAVAQANFLSLIGR